MNRIKALIYWFFLTNVQTNKLVCLTKVLLVCLTVMICLLTVSCVSLPKFLSLFLTDFKISREAAEPPTIDLASASTRDRGKLMFLSHAFFWYPAKVVRSLVSHILLLGPLCLQPSVYQCARLHWFDGWLRPAYATAWVSNGTLSVDGAYLEYSSSLIEYHSMWWTGQGINIERVRQFFMYIYQLSSLFLL